MAFELAKAFVSIRGDDKRLDADLQRSSGKLRSTIARLAPLAASFGAAFGVKQAVGAIQEQIQAERKLEATLRATGNAAGLTSGEIKKLASDLQSVTNFGDEVTISAAGILATFKNIKGDQFKELLAVSQDVSSVMGQSLQSSVVQLGKAMNDPATGLTMLTRIGITFSEQQKEQIKQLQKSGDLMGAQAVIMDELRSQFGGAAREMADPIVQAKNAVGDFVESIGSLVLPTINLFADGLTNLFGSAGELRETMETLGQDIAFIFGNLKEVVKLTALTWTIDLLEAIPMLEKPIQELSAFWVGTFEGIKAFFGSFIDNVIGGFKELMNVAEAVANAIAASFERIKAGDFAGIAQAFGDEFINTLANQTDVEAPNAFKAYADAFTSARDQVRQKFEEKGGLINMLKEEREELENLLGSRMLEQEQTKRERALAAAEEESVDAAAGLPEEKRKERRAGFVGITELSRQIQQAILPSKEQQAAQQTAKNTAETAKQMKENTKVTKEMAKKIGNQVAVLG